jgi:hypothetical protein
MATGKIRGDKSTKTLPEAIASPRKLSENVQSRYGVELKGFRFHKEAANVRQVLSVIDGVEGCVWIIDRKSERVLVRNAEEITEKMLHSLGTREKE